MLSRTVMEQESQSQVVSHTQEKVDRTVRDAGKSLLPFARVQKIIKADKVRKKEREISRPIRPLADGEQDIPIVAKEAVFLISLATEEFIKRLTDASRRVASGEKRVTVQQRDIGAFDARVFFVLYEFTSKTKPSAAAVVHSATEFVFLDGECPVPSCVAADETYLKKSYQGHSKSRNYMS